MAKIKNPSVLAYSKNVMPTNALMLSCEWDNKESQETIKLKTKTVLGTKSQRKGAGKEATDGNIQRVDFATLPADQDTVVVKYLVKFVGGVFTTEGCNDETYPNTAKENLQHVGFDTLACRYVYNIAAARPLWRNRVASEDVVTQITVGGNTYTFDSLEMDLNNFENDPQVEALSLLVSEKLSSEDDFVTLEVVHYSRLGFGMEVYPSEEFVEDTSKNKKSKVLFDIDGQAALHDQKVGNAIRTIDTWYPDATKPIAVEPYGSVVRNGKAYRAGNKKDFYTLLDTAVNKPESLTEEDKLFTIATLVRGGVFGG